MQEHKPEYEKGKPPPPPPREVPSYIMKELLEIREKLGRLEGMVEVLLKISKEQ